VQRGSNENANRRLGQYLAKGADLRRCSLPDLDDIARRINTRPRRVLDWATLAELLWPHVHAEYVPYADRRPGGTTERSIRDS
jgi:transposase, IS30 family